VLVEKNSHPDVKRRLGIKYAALSPINPRLVWASISSFGQHGPAATEQGFIKSRRVLVGLMSMTGEPGRGTMRAGTPSTTP
jgi:crotonobetainyl-CoA:carnitine CoA-transferase CaiB-like acyl-CoA transferase